MNIYKYVLFCLCIIIQSLNPLLAQDKFERERRIKRTNIPSKALIFIDSINNIKKLKWYLEEGLIEKSIEAKFKKHSSRYSAEFDTLGKIQDVEVEIKWSSLQPNLQQVIIGNIKRNCLHYKIGKVQRKFTGIEPDLLSVFTMSSNYQNLHIHYEIIAKCINKGNTELYEYLFTEHGEVVSTSRIVFKNSSHLEY